MAFLLNSPTIFYQLVNLVELNKFTNPVSVSEAKFIVFSSNPIKIIYFSLTPIPSIKIKGGKLNFLCLNGKKVQLDFTPYYTH